MTTKVESLNDNNMRFLSKRIIIILLVSLQHIQIHVKKTLMNALIK